MLKFQVIFAQVVVVVNLVFVLLIIVLFSCIFFRVCFLGFNKRFRATTWKGERKLLEQQPPTHLWWCTRLNVDVVDVAGGVAVVVGGIVTLYDLVVAKFKKLGVFLEQVYGFVFFFAVLWYYRRWMPIL